MNPARSFGCAAVTGVYKNLWVYIVAPVLRALAATALYNVLRVSEPVKSDPKDNTSTSMKFNRSLANIKMSKDYPSLAKKMENGSLPIVLVSLKWGLSALPVELLSLHPHKSSILDHYPSLQVLHILF